MQTRLLKSTEETIGQLNCNDAREMDFSSSGAVGHPDYEDGGESFEFVELEESFWSPHDVRQLLERNQHLVA